MLFLILSLCVSVATNGLLILYVFRPEIFPLKKSLSIFKKIPDEKACPDSDSSHTDSGQQSKNVSPVDIRLALEMLDSFQDTPYILDNNLRIKYLGNKIKEISSFPDFSYLISAPVMCFLTTESYRELKSITDELTEQNPESVFPVELLVKKQFIVRVMTHIKKVKLQNPSETFFVGSFRSMKLKEDEFNTEKNLYLLALEAGRTSIIITDTEGIIIHANKAFCLKSGWTADELAGRKSREFGNSVIPNVSEIKPRVMAGDTWQGESEIVTKDGGKYWELVSVAPVKNKFQEVTHFTIFREDITLLKDKYKILEQNGSMLQNQIALTSKVHSLLSHDLRNSVGDLKTLSGIICEDLSRRNPDMESVEKYSYMLLDDTTRTYAMLENMLSWSKSKFIHKNTYNEVIDIEDVIHHNIEMFKNLAGRKNISLQFNSSNFTDVYGDLSILNAVIRNLITNAIKYSFPEGEIILGVDIDQRNDENAIIYVADYGIGIDDIRKQTIFDIKELRSTPGTNNEKGTGLGLMLTKELIENNGGKIWVEDNKPKGTIFKFTVPFA